MENSSEVVAFYRGHRGPTRNLAGEGFSKPPSPENREDPAILAWKSGGLSPESDFKTARFRLILAVENAKFRTNFTNLDALLRPQFIQLRASNPTFCVLRSRRICPLPAFDFAEFWSFRIGFRCSFSTNFSAKRDVYCGKQRTGLRPNSSSQRTSSELGRPSVRSA